MSPKTFRGNVYTFAVELHRQMKEGGGNGLISGNAIDEDGSPLLIVIAGGRVAMEVAEWLEAKVRAEAAKDPRSTAEYHPKPWGSAV